MSFVLWMFVVSIRLCHGECLAQCMFLVCHYWPVMGMCMSYVQWMFVACSDGAQSWWRACLMWLSMCFAVILSWCVHVSHTVDVSVLVIGLCHGGVFMSPALWVLDDYCSGAVSCHIIAIYIITCTTDIYLWHRWSYMVLSMCLLHWGCMLGVVDTPWPGPPGWRNGKASASRAEDPGFKSRLHRDFFGVESYQWLKNWHSSVYPARRLAL